MKRKKLPAFIIAAKMGFNPQLNEHGQVVGRYGIKAVPGQYVRAYTPAWVPDDSKRISKGAAARHKKHSGKECLRDHSAVINAKR